jgi:hypothetical protein
MLMDMFGQKRNCGVFSAIVVGIRQTDRLGKFVTYITRNTELKYLALSPACPPCAPHPARTLFSVFGMVTLLDREHLALHVFLLSGYLMEE